MYKVLLVDDEDIIKIGLKSIIHWEDYGFEIISTASNGKQALDLVQTYQPDVIITDIVMPVMNGLELIEALHKLHYEGLIIVLSNYGDVNHVKTAMKLGAEDFILKFSYTKDDFINLLTSLEKLLKTKNVQASLPSVLNPPATPYDELEKYLTDDYYTDYPATPYIYHMYLICLPSHIANLVPTEYEIVYQKIHLILSQLLNTLNYHLFSVNPSSICIVVCSTNEKFLETHTLHNQIYETLSLYLMLDSSILYDLNIVGSVTLKKQYPLLLAKSTLTFYKPIFCNVSQLPLNTLCDTINPITITSTYLAHLNSNHFQLLQDEMSNTLSICESTLIPPCELKTFFTQVITSIQLYLYKEYFIEALSEYPHRINQCDVLSTLKLTLNDLICELSKLISLAKNGQHDVDLCEKIKLYVTHNLNKKITLNDLAQHLAFHPNYMSSYFKEHTGQTLSQYINEQKMAYAKQLLLDGNYKIKEVSHMIGIEDTFYFNRVFKRHFNCTPSELIACEKKI